jgi:hypothetical protein
LFFLRGSLAIGFCLLSYTPQISAQCNSLKTGETLWVRLLQPLSSYSGKAGDPVRAMVIQSGTCDGQEKILPGALIEGEIAQVRKVGMGLLHETAHLRVNFKSMRMADGTEVAITARVLEVDNARETVKDGTIHGVNAMDTPQGRITNRLRHLPTWNPYSDLTLLAYRTAFPMFPEPEIYFPRGTDMKLEMAIDAILPVRGNEGTAENVPDEIDKAVLEIGAPDLPQRTTTRLGQPADIVNIVLLGTELQMEEAFVAAGWKSGDVMSTRSVLRQMHAFLSFNNYAKEPITTQLLDGRRVDATWQKSLDSYAKREHLRVWGRSDLIEGQTVWVGAMTRETGAALSVRQHKFIHHIDAEMDDGRAMLARDLRLAGCVASVYNVERPTMEHSAMNSTGDLMRTDGAIEVVQLKDCEDAMYTREEEQPGIKVRPGSKIARYLRMQILSFKSDVVRGNILYGGFELVRMAVRARRHHIEKVMLPRRVEATPESESAAVLRARNVAGGFGFA